MPIITPTIVWETLELTPQRQIILTLADCKNKKIPNGMIVYLQDGKQIIARGCWRITEEGYVLDWAKQPRPKSP